MNLYIYYKKKNKIKLCVSYIKFKKKERKLNMKERDTDDEVTRKKN